MDITETSTFLCITLVFLGQLTACPLSHSTQNSNSKEETLNISHGTNTKHSLVMSLGWTRQGGMDDRPEQEKMQHKDCEERWIALFHICSRVKKIQLQQWQTDLPSVNTKHHTHWWFGSTECKVQLTFQKKVEEERGEQINRRETKPSVTIQAVQTKLKMGTGHKTQGSKHFLCSPLYYMHRWMSVWMYRIMYCCNYINEPSLLHMFLFTQELARHLILN